MASPELYRGICSICHGTLFVSNVQSWDLGDGRGGVHRGVCAIAAGIYPPGHGDRFATLLSDYKAAERNSDEANQLLKRFYQMAAEVSAEDHNADRVEHRFTELKEWWKADTETMSNLSDMVEHPAYQEVISMGWDVVSVLIQELRQEPEHWFVALATITGTDVAQGEATPAGAAQKWVQWWDSTDWTDTQGGSA